MKAQTFDSNGPDVRIRGNAHQVYEKYLNLARDASAGGDRVLAESYWQFAEHYYRIIHESTDPESPGSHRPHFRDPRYDEREWEQGGEESYSNAQGGETAGEAASSQPAAPAAAVSPGAESESDEDRAGLERALGSGRGPRREAAEGEVNGQAPREPRDGQAREGQSREGQSREGQTREGQTRGRNRFRRRYQNAEEGEAAAPARRPFPPRAESEEGGEEKAASAAPVESADD